MAILKFLHKRAPSEVMVLIQNFLFHFLKNELDFHEISSVDASKHVAVHLVLFSKLDHKILSYGHFNIISQESTQ